MITFLYSPETGEIFSYSEHPDGVDAECAPGQETLKLRGLAARGFQEMMRDQPTIRVDVASGELVIG